MKELILTLFENDYFLTGIFVIIIGIPIISFLVYEYQPEWYKKSQEMKYAKVTLVILILCAFVLILNRVGVIQ
jgi:hypothetical protein